MTLHKLYTVQIKFTNVIFLYFLLKTLKKFNLKLNSLPYDRSKEPWKWFYVVGFLVLTKKTQKTIENDLKIYINFSFSLKKNQKKSKRKY